MLLEIQLFLLVSNPEFINRLILKIISISIKVSIGFCEIPTKNVLNLAYFNKITIFFFQIGNLSLERA